MRKLTAKQKRMIIAERHQGATFEALAKKYGVSNSAISYLCKHPPAPEFEEELTAKNREIEETILAHMERQAPQVNLILDDLLEAIGSKDRQARATILQLATTMGILIDKFSFSKTPAGQKLQNEDDPITKALKESFDHAKRKTAGDS